MGKSLGRYLPELLTLKITLDGSEPKIWRRVALDSGLTLHDLHVVIQILFSWENSHLYQFHVTEGGKLTGRAWANAVRYHVMPTDDVFDDDNAKPADEAMIGRVFTDDRKLIVYEYDFGDSWMHLVKLEKRVPNDDPDRPPVCLNGQNAAPLDDMGGIGGYHDYLDALRDDTHELHDDAVERLGETFDPAAFDPDAATKTLAEVFRPAPKRPRKPRKKPDGEAGA